MGTREPRELGRNYSLPDGPLRPDPVVDPLRVVDDFQPLLDTVHVHPEPVAGAAEIRRVVHPPGAVRPVVRTPRVEAQPRTVVVQRRYLPALAVLHFEDPTVRGPPDAHLPRSGRVGGHAHANRVVTTVRTRTTARRRRRAVQTLVGLSVAVVVPRVAGLGDGPYVVAGTPSAVRVAGLLTNHARTDVRATYPYLPGVAVPRAHVLVVDEPAAVVVHAIPAHFAGERVDQRIPIVAVHAGVRRDTAGDERVVAIPVLVAGARPRLADVVGSHELHAGQTLRRVARPCFVQTHAIVIARVHGARVAVVALPLASETEVVGAFVAPLGRNVRELPILQGPDEAELPLRALRIVGHSPAPVARVAGIHRALESIVADDEVVRAPTLHVADVGRTRVPIVALLGLPALGRRGAPRRIVVRVRDARACVARVRDPVPIHVTVAPVAVAVLVQIRLIVLHVPAVVLPVRDTVAVRIVATSAVLAEEVAVARTVRVARAVARTNLALRLGRLALTLALHGRLALTLAGLALLTLRPNRALRTGLARLSGLALLTLRPNRALRTSRPLGTSLAALALRAVAVADVEGVVAVRVLRAVVHAVHVEVPAPEPARAGRAGLTLRTRLARGALEPVTPDHTHGRHRGHQEHALHAHLLCLVSDEDFVVGREGPLKTNSLFVRFLEPHDSAHTRLRGPCLALTTR